MIFIYNISHNKDFSKVPIESVKKFWNERPCNIKHSAKPIGTREYFDEVEKRKYFVEPHIPKFAEFAKWKGKKVLEIGFVKGTEASTLPRMAQFTQELNYQKKVLNYTN